MPEHSREAADEAKQKLLRMGGQLVADLATIFDVIIRAERMDVGPFDAPAVQGDLATIVAASDRALDVMAQLSVFVRHSAGIAPLMQQALRLHQATREGGGGHG